MTGRLEIVNTAVQVGGFCAVDAKWIAFAASRELPIGCDAAQLSRIAQVLDLNLDKPLSGTV